MNVVITYALSAVLLFSTLFVLGRELGSTFAEVSGSSAQQRSRLAQQADTRIAGLNSRAVRVLSTSTVQMMLSNEGDVALGDFTDWDVIVELQGSTPLRVAELEYSEEDLPAPGQWTVRAIYTDADVLTREYVEPGVLNVGERMRVLLNAGSPVDYTTRGRATFATANGTSVKILFKPVFQHYFHSQTAIVGPTSYYVLDRVEPEGPPLTLSSVFQPEQTGLLRPAPRDGKFVSSLADVSQIPPSTWNLTYRVKRGKADFGFVWFTDAQDVSLTATGSWQDIDLSSLVPSKATGAIVEVVNSRSQTQLSGLIRGKADTRDYVSNPNFQRIGPFAHRWQVVKLDAGGLIQGYIEDPDIDFKLLGYTLGPDPSYFTTPPDVTPSIQDQWTAVDVSPYVDADADGVVLFIESQGAPPRDYGIREVGSTFSDTTRSLGPFGNTAYVVGLDSLKRFEAYTTAANFRIYLVGQTRGSVVHYVDDVAVPDPATSAWLPRDADGYGVPLEAQGLFLRVDNTNSATDYRLSLKRGGSSDDWNGDIPADGRLMGAVGIDGDNVWLEFMENSALDVSIAAYTRGVRMDLHANIDALIRRSDGSVRTVLETHAAETTEVTDETWQTFTAGLAFPGYNVVTPTDFLEVDLFGDATFNASGEPVSLDFLVDEPTLPTIDQAQLQENF